jgi:hypothetical protein
LRLACNNIYLILFTGVEIIEITSINVNGEFWFPCLFFDEFPDVNINVKFACNNSYIGDFACCDVGFDVLGNDEGGAVGKGSSDEENVKLHDLLYKGPAFGLCV